ncbi:MAG: flagellar biosynthesis anti-sigma factor FlgM [Chloroflexi bacterium]|nr:flagellar biosynthesis anti-sigma factor FlgM [Chloroflexota bacterium]
MEIDKVGSNLAHQYVSQTQAAQQIAAVKGEAARKSSGQDRVDLSPEALLLQHAQQAALDAPDLRADLVDQVRQRIATGSYQIDAARIADRLLGGDLA